MQQTHIQQLAEVLQLSQQMLNLAQSGNWPEVTVLEARRNEQIAACFSQAVAAKDAIAIERTIREILDLNQAIYALGQLASNDLAKELSNQASGKAALTAYRDCAATI